MTMYNVDRIRKGFPHEARVITRIMPSFLIDLCPSQDIMNKVIGEFLYTQQPHPQLMAELIFEVTLVDIFLIMDGYKIVSLCWQMQLVQF